MCPDDQYNYKGPYKREARRSKSGKGDVAMGPAVGVMEP